MVGHLKIGKLEFTFVFRHKFEKDLDALDKITMWKEYKLGLWYKRYQIVGRKNFKDVSEWKNNHVYQYMVGINLIVCNAWFTVCKGGMSLKIN